MITLFQRLLQGWDLTFRVVKTSPARHPPNDPHVSSAPDCMALDRNVACLDLLSNQTRNMGQGLDRVYQHSIVS